MQPDEIWAMFYQRDTILLVFFLGPLGALALYATYRWGELEEFLKQHPLMKRDFDIWVRHKPKVPNPNECPEHKILVFGRGSCPAPGCHWKPPKT